MASAKTTAPSAGRSAEPSRRQRSDAKRNVVALVAAAKTVFAVSGVDAPAKEITDLAGVGVGTLYRHFPRRSDLIVAVLQHEIDECVEAAEELGTTLSPWDALMGWIERFTDFVGTKRGLASALHSGDPAYDDLPEHLLDRLEPALRTLLARAADGGYARDDVTAREVLMTIALICQPVPGQQPSFNQRMTRVFMQGLGRVARAGDEPRDSGGKALTRERSGRSGRDTQGQAFPSSREER
jgi:AcrR family transcriptional regulator